MSSIVYLKNKSSGKVYAYLNESVWNSTLKKCECKRKCLGHVDPITGDIVPNKGNKKDSSAAMVNSLGMSHFLKGVSDKCGLTAALETAFPTDWKLILSTAFYLIDTDSSTLSRMTYWSKDNDCPYGKEVLLSDLSEMLMRISDNDTISFFRGWRDAHDSEDFYLSHTSSTSSFDMRTGDILFNNLPIVTITPKTSLSMLYTHKGGIPITYSVWDKTPVNTGDLDREVKEKMWLDLTKITHVLDSEFCNDSNIDMLFKNNSRFILRAPSEFYFARDAIERVRDRILSSENLKVIGGEQLFVMSFLNYWKGKRCYTHIYYSTKNAESEFTYLLGLIDDCYRELETNLRVREHERVYKEYFSVADTDEGRKVTVNGDAIMSYNDVAGFFVLVSNSIRSPVTAMNIYHQKDMVQREFEDLRNERDRASLKLYSDVGYHGRIFVQFICLILKVQIKKRIKSNALLKEMGVQGIIQEMKALKKVTIPGFDIPFYTKVNSTQAEIMKAFGMDPMELTSTPELRPVG